MIQPECESAARELSSDQFLISQGYLSSKNKNTIRIRKSIRKSDNSDSYFFTFKVNTAGRCIEVETEIDQRDFDDLWLLAKKKLTKIRYIVEHGNNIWELDFLKNHKNQTYLAIAEVELPEDQLEPDIVLDLVKINNLFKVPLNDNRFSNKMLSNIKYAKKLLNEILRK